MNLECSLRPNCYMFVEYSTPHTESMGLFDQILKGMVDSKRIAATHMNQVTVNIRFRNRIPRMS